MKRFLMILTALALVGLGAAQTVAPTSTVDGFDVDGSKAEVTQTVSVTVPEIFALHLDATHLDFDLTNLVNQESSEASGDIVCVYGVRDFDGFLDPDDDLNNYAAGTRYAFAGNTWLDENDEPLISIVDVNGDAATRVTDWPRIELEDGELVDKDAPVVCYRTFKMQKYTNSVDGWKLAVERTGDIAGVNLYIQDNTRCFYNGSDFYDSAGGVGAYYDNAAGVPMLALEDGDTLPLLEDTATTWGYNGTTTSTCGETAGAAADYKGWLDDLVIVAVEIGTDTPAIADQETELTYTLMPF